MLKIDIQLSPEDGSPRNFSVFAKNVRRPMTRAMKLFAVDMRGEVEKSFASEGQLKPWPKPKRREGKTLQDTGRLKQSLQYKHTADTVTVGSTDVRSRILFTGGVIKPKRAKVLAIPLGDHVTKAPREYEDTFILPRKPGDDANSAGIIMEVRRDGSVRPIFALRKSVIIPPRPYVENTPTLRARFNKRILDHLNKE